ncbi:MAG: putative peptidoglycan glycosyltransferase FtsW [Anaerolineales bacterium]|nr:putative peptidoglycan glycosyltransferase FtsW [Anaerolineales bacterium]
MDLPLALAVLGLLVFGLIMLFSASWDFSLSLDNSPMHMFNRQLMWLGIGLAGALALANFDYHHYRKWIVPVMALTILLLLGVLLVQEIRLGAKRAFFEGSAQPSELAKIISIIYLSVWLYSKQGALHQVGFGLLPLSVILGIVGGLIFLQPDLSAAGTVILMGGLLFFLAGGDLKQIVFLLAVTAAVAWVIVQVSSTGQQRLGDFIAGIKDPTQASYHVLRSFEAIVQGGFFGVGLGNSQSKLTGLPVPPTDSIFAVLVEELGLVGAIFLMGLYALLIWRGMVIARRAPDMLGTLLASGLVIWIGIEALINMAVMVGLMPFAGNALPFISAGGSNLIVMLAAIGILLNISRQRGAITETDDGWRSFGAIVNLRWRNGRRRISRPRRA